MRRLALNSPDVFDAFVQWMGDDLSRQFESPRLRVWFIKRYENLVQANEPLALSVLQMPFLEQVDQASYDLLDVMWRMASRYGDALDELLTDPARIAEEQVADIYLLYLEQFDAEAADTIRGFPWVLDGITDRSEQERVMEWVSEASSRGRYFQDYVKEHTVLAKVSEIARAWAEDGLDSAEVALLSMIDGLSSQYPVWLNDNLDVVLDRSQTFVEQRPITLPLAGKVQLLVVRPGVRAAIVSETLDLLEQAVRSQEAFMRVPFPQKRVVILAADVHRFGGTGGHHALIVSNYAEHRGVIAHETAHTYWSFPRRWVTEGDTRRVFPPTWIVEGGASFLDVIAHRAYDGTPLPDSELPCDLFNNLYELEHSELGWDEIFDSGCNYHLGRGIFRELYNRLGDDAFRQGFGNLYLSLREESHEDVCAGEDRSACYLRLSFTDGLTRGQVLVLNEVLDRRYYGR